jgi:DNA replication protein DnaC
MNTETARSRKPGVRPCLRRCGNNTQWGDAGGSTEVAIVVPRRSWRKFFLEVHGNAHRRSRGGGKSENPAAGCGIFKCCGKVLLLDFSTERLFPRPLYSPMVQRAANTPKENAMTKKPSQPMPVLAIPKLSEGQLEPLFRRLNLAHTRRIYQEVADRAEKENWTYRDFLALLLAEEVAHRKQTRLQRGTRQAHFPFFKTIDEFDFTLQSTLRQSLLGSYLGPDFVTEGRSLILYGKTGRGKTHLAVAIGYRAIQNGFDTLCTTAAELIEDLSNASAKGLLHQSLSAYTRPHVLVIDEIGYLSYGPDAANVLFHVVNDRHLRKRPMIFTTNKPLSEWGKVLHDEDLAAAILDRVLERGRFVHLDGPSGRTRHLNLEEASPAKAERLRISGINGSEFPEPTTFFGTGPRRWNSIGFAITSLQSLASATAFEGCPVTHSDSPFSIYVLRLRSLPELCLA